MGDTMTFGPGHGPLIRDGLQERFWALFSAQAEAMNALWQAERTGIDVAQAAAVREQAQARLEAFARQHPGRAFAVFKPEDIAAALDPTIAPLFPIGDL